MADLPVRARSPGPVRPGAESIPAYGTAVAVCPAGTSLAKLLEKHRGVRVGRGPPNLSEKQILVWADAHFAARGKWPTRESGPIAGTRESWLSVDLALRTGDRGLRGGSSLPQLLARRRGVRNRLRPPPLKEKQILAWALAYCKTTGRWPSVCSAPIAGSRGDTWISVEQGPEIGTPGIARRSKPGTTAADSRLEIALAADYNNDHGPQWPDERSGAIPDTEETWRNVQLGAVQRWSRSWAALVLGQVAGPTAGAARPPSVRRSARQRFSPRRIAISSQTRDGPARTAGRYRNRPETRG